MVTPKSFRLETRAVLLLVLVVGWVLWSPDMLNRVDLDSQFLSPSATRWFGTDELGRDAMRRVGSGILLSLTLVLTALVGAVVLGVIVGSAATLHASRWSSTATNSLINIVWSLPGLVFLMAATTYFGRGPGVIAMAMACTAWVPIARVVQAEIQRQRHSGRITAMKAFGHGELAILRSMLRSARRSIAVSVLTVALDLLAIESGLSFLGLGVQPPTPSVGGLIYTGLSYISVAWWLLVFPLLALLVSVALLRQALQSLSGGQVNGK